MISERPYFRTSKFTIAIVLVLAVGAGIAIFATDLNTEIKSLIAAIPIAVGVIGGFLERVFRERFYKDLEKEYSESHQINSAEIQERAGADTPRRLWSASDQEVDQFIQET